MWAIFGCVVRLCMLICEWVGVGHIWLCCSYLHANMWVGGCGPYLAVLFISACCYVGHQFCCYATSSVVMWATSSVVMWATNSVVMPPVLLLCGPPVLLLWGPPVDGVWV